MTDTDRWPAGPGSGTVPGFRAGFDSLDTEITADLPVRGRLPAWLTGTLLRNGPARFEAGDKPFRHWFDGQAMLHRFAIADGRVSYRNRFLDTASSRSVRQRGRISYPEFATDPCSSLFGRFFTRFSRRATPNAAVSIAVMSDRFVALTETPLPVEFSPDTLATAGVVGYQDALKGQVTTAHPHREPDGGGLLNYVLRFGRSSEYRVYRQRGGTLRRDLLAAVPAGRPAYMHSFGVGRRYLVLAEFPLVVNPLALLLSGRPFIENFRWRPERGTLITVVDLADGSVAGRHQAEPFFAFHHVNAYEDGRELVVDLCAYRDAQIVSALYLDALRAGRGIPLARPTRYRLDLRTGRVRPEPLAGESLELPGIAYRRHNGRPYRHAYGVGARGGSGDDFTNQLVKVDVGTGECRVWHEAGCYPGEPVLVPAPAAAAEDDGVVLSVVLDPGARRSYLLVLDARSFTELARAEVPHAIPFGFHGRFTPDRPPAGESP